MLKIRLMRIGAKGRPFYRVVVVDERNKRNGAYLDLLGTYNPLTEPKEIKIDSKKLEEWLKKGAQKSDGLLRILKEAPQKHRKPKKEQPAEAAPKAEEAAPAEAAPAEETQDAGQASMTEAAESTDSSSATQNDNNEEKAQETASEAQSEPVAEVQTEEQIATEPETPRNDEVGEDKKEEAAS